MSKQTPTPDQTVGPFYGYAPPSPKDSELLAPGIPGTIQLQGTVYDGAGHPIPDAILEIWRAATYRRLIRTAVPVPLLSDTRQEGLLDPACYLRQAAEISRRILAVYPESARVRAAGARAQPSPNAEPNGAFRG